MHRIKSNKIQMVTVAGHTFTVQQQHLKYFNMNVIHTTLPPSVHRTHGLMFCMKMSVCLGLGWEGKKNTCSDDVLLNSVKLQKKRTGFTFQTIYVFSPCVYTALSQTSRLDMYNRRRAIGCVAVFVCMYMCVCVYVCVCTSHILSLQGCVKTRSA